MDIVKLNDTLTEIDGRVRVEQGPEMKTAIATPEILSDDVTAPHYQVGKRDKLGKVIVLGQEFSYLDWKAPAETRPWHIYELCVEDWTGANTIVLDEDGEPVPHPDDPSKVKTEVGPAWRRRGHYFDQQEAMIAATELAQNPSAGAV